MMGDNLGQRFFRAAAVVLVALLQAPSIAVLVRWWLGQGEKGSLLEGLGLVAFFSWPFFLVGGLVGAVILVASPASRRNPWLWFILALGAFGQSKFGEVVGYF